MCVAVFSRLLLPAQFSFFKYAIVSWYRGLEQHAMERAFILCHCVFFKSCSPHCFWSPFILLLSDFVLCVAMCQCRSTWRGGAACSATSASTNWTPASTRGSGQRWKTLWVMHLHISFLTVWKVCSEKRDILDQWKWQTFPSILLDF